MAQRKAKKPKRKAGKARTKRPAGRKTARKAARKAPRRAAGGSRNAGDRQRIAELEAENRRLREEVDSLRGERVETGSVETPEPDEGTDSFE